MSFFCRIFSGLPRTGGQTRLSPFLQVEQAGPGAAEAMELRKQVRSQIEFGNEEPFCGNISFFQPVVWRPSLLF